MDNLKARIVAERERSAKAFADAQAIREEFASFDGDVPADKMEQFNRAIDASTAALERAQQLEAQSSQLEKLEEAHRAPVNALPTAGRETQRNVAADTKAEAHKKSWHAWARGDRDEAAQILRDGGFSRGEAHALISGDDSKLGYLVPDDVRAEVIERRAAVAVIRSLVNVVSCSSDVLVYPRIAANAGTYATSYQSGFAGDWDTEQGSTTETSGSVTVKTQQNQPTGEMVRIQIHNWIANPVVVSTSLLEDSAAPLDSILARHIGTTAGLDEDFVCIRGSGVNQPSGIINASITAINSGAASNVTYGGLLDLIYGLPAQYAQGASLLMRRSTMGEILALETGSGTDLVFKNNAAVGPNNLLGYPVVFSDFMPTCTTGSNKAIAFGDFSSGYVLADRQSLRIQRLNERYAPNVGFAPTARIGGAVVLPEAFRLMNISS